MINKINPEGEVLWTSINENYQIIGTPAFDNNNNLFVALISAGNDSTEIDSTFRRNIYTSIRGYDSNGIIFTKTNVFGSIESSLLVNQGDIYFGSTDGVIFKKSYPVFSEVRNELPIWGTFQGNNQRTGNQSTNQLTQVSEFLVPNNYQLHQNYPNPFNPITTLNYDLPTDSFVEIIIYDMLGNVVNNLINKNQNSGHKSIQWNATNNLGQLVSAGVYLYSIEAGDFRQTKKMILLK